MKRILMALILAFGAIGIVKAQNSLSGVITDKTTNEPLPGATVYIPDLKKGTTATIDGNFTLNSLPKGRFLVEISMTGYNTYAATIAIDSITRLTVQLDESVAEVNEVVVTGVSKATEMRRNPVPAAIVSKNGLLIQPGSNIIDVISRQPGISQLSTGVAVSKPIIRGLGYNRVVTLNNGMRQEGQQWGDEHGIEIDEYAIDRAEIIKGPGSLMYGSDAIAGVMNFLAPKPIDEGIIIGELLTNYQTNNGLFGISGMTAGQLKGIHWLGRISSKQAGSYSNKYDGRVYNSGFNELNFSGTVGLNKKWGFVHLNISSFNQNIGMVEGERDSLGNFIYEVAVNDSTTEEATVPSDKLNTYQLAVPRQRVNHNRVSLQNFFVLGKSRLAINLAYQQNRRREYGNVLAPDEEELYFFLQTANYDIKYSLPEKRGWETTTGISGMLQSNANRGEEYIIPAYSLHDYGFFVVTKKTIKKLNIMGGIRYDVRQLKSNALWLDSNEQKANGPGPGIESKFAAFTRSFGNSTWSLGGTYNITKKLLVKANVAKGFRAPNMSEMASNGKHEGTLRYEYGNTALKAETSIQGDLGASYESEHVTFEVSVFQNRISNYIYLQKLKAANGGDSIADPNDPAPAYSYVQDAATLTGGEITVDFHPHPFHWLHIQNSVSYVQAVNNAYTADSNKYLPFIPPLRYQGELRGHFKKVVKYITKAYVSLQYTYHFAQNRVLLENSTETSTPAYGLVNLGVGGTLVKKNKKPVLEIYLSANNLLNTAYQSHLNRLKYAAVNPATGRTGVFNMGRNVSIKVVVPMVFRKK